MLSYRQFRNHTGGCRWRSEQTGSVARSAVVGRLVVPNATRLRAKTEADDEETVFSVCSGLHLKARRGRASLPAQPPRDPSAAVHLVSDRFDELQTDGSDAAALRDATATASTSGNDIPHPSQTAAAALVALKQQRKLPLRTAIAAAGAAASASAGAAATATAMPPRSGGHASSPSTATAADRLDITTSILPVSSTPPPAAATLFIDTRDHTEQQPQQQQEAQQQQQQQAHPLPAGVTQERDREIHNELRGCEDWRDVLDVVADEAACLSVRTAVQALTRLNTLTRGSAIARRELVEHSAFQTLKEVLYSQVSLMNNVQLSNSLHAFAQLQVVLPELLLEGYAAAAAARAATFFPRDIATLLAAAAAMRWSPPRELLDAMGFRAMGFLSGPDFDARSIPTLLHSIALLGYKNPLLAQAAAQRLAAPGVMASLAPQGVANSMWALGRLDTYYPPAVAAALSAFSSAPFSYKPQEVANLLWALTALRHHPEADFVLFARSLLHRNQQQPPPQQQQQHDKSSGFGSGFGSGQIRAADLATLLYALATFNVSPGAKVMERLETCTQELLDGAAADEGVDDGMPASGVVAAAATARPGGSRSSNSRGSSSGGGGGGSGRISVVELAHMYWGMALLGAVDRPLFGRLEVELAAAWEREGAEIPESLLRTAFQGFLASKLDSPRRSHCLTPLALDAMKRAWTADLTAATTRKGRGRRVDQVASILDTLKVTYDKQRPTGDGLALIDIALKAGPERYVALQVIDTADRCANSKQLLGQMVVVGQVLEKNGWEVRYLRSSDLDNLTPEMQVRFVEELLRGIGVRVRKGTAEAAAAAATGAPPSTPRASAAVAAAAAARDNTRVRAVDAAHSRALKGRARR